MPSISQLTDASTDEITNDAYLVLNTEDGATRKVTIQELKDNVLCGTYCKRVDITSAEVLNMNSSPIELLAAPTTGTAYQFMSIFMVSEFVSAAYATNVQLEILDASGAVISPSANLLGYVADVDGMRLTMADNTNSDSLARDAVEMTNSTGNPTAGDSDITLFLHYRIITL